MVNNKKDVFPLASPTGYTHTLYSQPVRIDCSHAVPHARSFNSMTNTKQHEKRRYVTRRLGQMCQSKGDQFLPWPTCEVHYDLVTTNFDFYSYTNFDFYSWLWDSISDPHAPIHFWLGGNLDCATTYTEIGNLVGADVAEMLAFWGSGFRKKLFCDRILGLHEQSFSGREALRGESISDI